jgi:uncharacterized protein
MHYLWIGLAGGALAFAHCLGMCGGFVLHLSRGAGRRTVLGRQLLWHAGKTFTYIFLGAVAAFGGSALTRMANLPWVQNVLSYAAGVLIILMGLSLIGLLPVLGRRPSAERGAGLFPSVLQQFVREPTLPSAFVMGITTGFLPCPIVLGFLALAAQSASVVAGMALMAAVGVGTLWSLLLLGFAGQLAMPRTRRLSAIVGGILLVILGTVTIARGTALFHRVLGCPSSEHSCCRDGSITRHDGY